MPLPPHREKDVKVEGRDPPETVKETMAPFRSLLGKLLNVQMNEVEKQQQLHEAKMQQSKISRKLKTERKNAMKFLPSKGKQTDFVQN